MPGYDGYKIIVKKACSAIKKVKSQTSVDRIFFVWLQGESDAVCGNSKAYYKERITELIEAFKKDIGIEKIGLIRVGRFTNDERDFEIISAQDEMCIENTDFLMLTEIAIELNAQKEYMNPYVRGHYSAKGLEKLGTEVEKSLANHIK